MIINVRLKAGRREEGEDGPQAAALQLSQSWVTASNAVRKEMLWTTTSAIHYDSIIC